MGQQSSGALPLASAAKLLLLYGIPNTLPADVRQRAEIEAHDHLQKAAASAAQIALFAGTTNLAIETAIDIGEPFDEILRRAGQIGAQLAVFGRHGHRPARHLFIGSTARRLIGNGDLPVLVVSRKPECAYRYPLIALNLDDAAGAIVELGAKLVSARVKVVPVVHACRVPFEGWIRPGLTHHELNRCRQEFRSEATSKLMKLSQSFAEQGLRLKVVVKQGRVAPVILSEIARRRSDLVVLGSDRRSRFPRAMLGSIGETTAQTVPCDVLVV